MLVRRVRQEVLSQLPPRTDTRVSVPMTGAQQEEHDALIAPIAALVGAARRRPLTQPEFLRLMTLLTQQRIISNGLAQLRFDELWPVDAPARPEPSLLEGLFAPKLLELRRIVESVVVEQGRKAVVFSQWRRMLRLAAWATGDVLADAGRRAVFFTGAESTRQRHPEHRGLPRPARASRVMFLSDAGGVGLNLQRAANACINLELPWNPAVLEQRIGRIYRLGQKHPIDVYNLVSEGGIESRIAELVATKQALFSGPLRRDDRRGLLRGRQELVPGGRRGSSCPRSPRWGAKPTRAVAMTARRRTGTSPRSLEARPRRRALRPRVPRAVDGARVELPSSLDVPALFATLRVERTAEGGLRLEAPPAAAASLASLFEGMARLLGQAAR